MAVAAARRAVRAAGGGLATALLGGRLALRWPPRRDRRAGARRSWPTAGDGRRSPWSAGSGRGGGRGLRRGAGSAASPATCSAPPAWWPRRSRSSWRRPRGEPARSSRGALGLLADRLLGEPPRCEPHPVARLRSASCSAVERRLVRRQPGGRRRPRGRRVSARVWPPGGLRRALDRGWRRTSRWPGGASATPRSTSATRSRPATSTAPGRCCRRSWGATRRSSTTRGGPRRRGVGGREHRRRGGGAGAVGRGGRRAGRARPPGGEHHGRHGGPPQRALRALRLGRRPARRRRRLGPRPRHRRARGRVPARHGGRRCGRRCAATPRPTRRPTAAWPRRRSPPPSGCASAARAATATASSSGRPSATAGPRGRRHRRAPSRLSRDVTLALAGRPGRRGPPPDAAMSGIPRRGRARRRRRAPSPRALGLDPATSSTCRVAQPVRSRRRRSRRPPRRCVGRYPDAESATAALGRGARRGRDRLVLTNGGARPSRWSPGRSVGALSSEPEFSLHPRPAAGPRWREQPAQPVGRAGRAGRAGRRVGRGLLPAGHRRVDQRRRGHRGGRLAHQGVRLPRAPPRLRAGRRRPRGSPRASRPGR